MHAITIPMADTTMESSIDDDDDDDDHHLEDELLERRREARRRRRQRRQHRRAEPQQQARQIRRRHRVQQELQQRIGYQQRRTSAVDDEMIEGRWLEMYDGAMMSPTDRWEEEEEEQAPRMPQTIAQERDTTQWPDMEPMSMSPSFQSEFEPMINDSATMEMTDEEMIQFFDLDPPIMASHQQPATTPLNDHLSIPSYLSSTDEPNFVKMIEQHRPSLEAPLNREHIRHVAILMHHLTVLELERSLWKSYLQCGTDLLPSHPSERVPFWPTSVVTLLKERASDDDCLRFVQQKLCELNNEDRVLVEQWQARKKQIDDYERVWEHPIRALVVEHTESFRQQIQSKIQLVQFDYRAHRLQGDFRQESPSPAQMQHATRLLDLKYQSERARREVVLLGERIVHNKLPSWFDALQGPAPHSFRALFDTQLGQQLNDRQQAILQYHRQEMLALYRDIVEAKQDESQALFHDAMLRMREGQQRLPLADRFSPTMLHILDQQFALVTERLESTAID